MRTLLRALGVRIVEEERDAMFEPVARTGIVPPEFDSITIFPTDARASGVTPRLQQRCRVRQSGMRSAAVGEQST